MKIKRLLIVVVALAALSGRAAAWYDQPVARSVEEDASVFKGMLYANSYGICDHEGEAPGDERSTIRCALNDAGTAKMFHDIYTRRLARARLQSMRHRVLAFVERVRGLPDVAEGHKDAEIAARAGAILLERRIRAVELVLIEFGWAERYRDGVRYRLEEGRDWAARPD